MFRTVGLTSPKSCPELKSPSDQQEKKKTDLFHKIQDTVTENNGYCDQRGQDREVNISSCE